MLNCNHRPLELCPYPVDQILQDYTQSFDRTQIANLDQTILITNSIYYHFADFSIDYSKLQVGLTIAHQQYSL